tara:strand:+ start:2561 stop:3148 length:588 start_codon:yes stop_codon:yes gene_type:complete
MIDKIKILTKIKDFKSVQKSLQDIESKLNMLKDSVNKPAESDTDERKGKTGDTNIHRGRDGNYRFNIRTKKGWESPILKPHYDSGWKSITNNSNYTFNHHLGSKFLLLQTYFRATTAEEEVAVDDIFAFNTSSIENHVSSTGSNDDAGINIQMISNNSIKVYTANHYVFTTDTPTYGEHAGGDIRIFAWKIGIRL